MKRFILLIQFLTRIPINLQLDVSRDDLSKAVIYFPVVGGIIGFFLILFYYLFSSSFDRGILLFLIILLEVLITGGLHIDGLSDTFDGIFSNRSKERILEIMKDPNVGTFGMLSIIFLFGFKYLLLYYLSKDLLVIIFFMPIVARFCVVLASSISKYSREKGLGNLFIGQTSRQQVGISFLFTMIPILFCKKLLFGYIVSVGFTLYFVHYISKRIDGITGDVLGAIVELNEVIFLLSMYVLQKVVV